MPTALVSAETLVGALGDPSLCLLDCRYDLKDPGAGRAAYAAGHLPGAVYADLGRDLAGPHTAGGGRHPLPEPRELAERLGAWGIDGGVSVVAYDDSAGLYAARAWWLLRAMGHGDVRVLDGGLAAWRTAGGPLVDTPSTPRARRFRWDGRPLPGLSIDEVARRLADGTITLVDVRAAERFEGRTEPLDPVAGHVPGAVNLPQSLSLRPDGRFRSPEELRQLFDAPSWASRHAEIVCMCGSGVTACHTLLAMEIAGRPGGRLYAGSWSEWCRAPGRGVATGPAT